MHAGPVVAWAALARPLQGADVWEQRLEDLGTVGSSAVGPDGLQHQTNVDTVTTTLVEGHDEVVDVACRVRRERDVALRACDQFVDYGGRRAVVGNRDRCRTRPHDSDLLGFRLMSRPRGHRCCERCTRSLESSFADQHTEEWLNLCGSVPSQRPTNRWARGLTVDGFQELPCGLHRHQAGDFVGGSGELPRVHRSAQERVVVSVDKRRHHKCSV